MFIKQEHEGNFFSIVTSCNLQTVSNLINACYGVSSKSELRIRIFQVILLHVKNDAKEKAKDIQISIDVDMTLEDILIVLSVEADPSITLSNPTGNVRSV